MLEICLDELYFICFYLELFLYNGTKSRAAEGVQLKSDEFDREFLARKHPLQHCDVRRVSTDWKHKYVVMLFSLQGMHETKYFYSLHIHGYLCARVHSRTHADNHTSGTSSLSHRISLRSSKSLHAKYSHFVPVFVWLYEIYCLNRLCQFPSSP